MAKEPCSRLIACCRDASIFDTLSFGAGLRLWLETTIIGRFVVNFRFKLDDITVPLF